jgi:hypothetical protein
MLDVGEADADGICASEGGCFLLARVAFGGNLVCPAFESNAATARLSGDAGENLSGLFGLGALEDLAVGHVVDI